MIIEKIKGQNDYCFSAIIKCDCCGKEFRKAYSFIKNRENHFCNRECMGKWNRLNRVGINAPTYGRTHSEETKEKISKNHSDVKGKNNPMYGVKRIGRASSSWKGGIKKCNGYILVKNYNHPNHNKENYILEHRLIMEKHLGRYLKPEEVIHHKDGNGINNNIENLGLFANQAEHVRYHNYNGGGKSGYIG
jgi:hypothetical protein